MHRVRRVLIGGVLAALFAVPVVVASPAQASPPRECSYFYNVLAGNYLVRVYNNAAGTFREYTTNRPPPNCQFQGFIGP